MVIDSFQKRFLMNMHLRQCFSRAKPFRLKKIQKKPDFVWLFLISKKSQRCSKIPEFQNLASKKPNWWHCTEAVWILELKNDQSGGKACISSITNRFFCLQSSQPTASWWSRL